MLDLGFVRDNRRAVEEMLRKRGIDPKGLLGDFWGIDNLRREHITTAETLRAKQNQGSEEVIRRKRNGEDATDLIAEMKTLREKIIVADTEATARDDELKEILKTIRNLPHSSVPIGHSADENVEVRRWGSPVKFDFPPKPLWELGEQLGILDLERAAKISGARFAVYWEMGARLERALANFMLDVHTREHGYTEVLPPYIVNSESMYGTGQLPKFADDLFKCEKHDLW